MQLPRDPRDFQRLNPERYAKCYSRGEPIPCKFELLSIELLREGNWMRLGKCKGGGKAAAAKNETSLALADGSPNFMNALQSFMRQQNMCLQRLMHGQPLPSFIAPCGPRIEILGDQQRFDVMRGLPQSAPALRRLQSSLLPGVQPGLQPGVQPGWQPDLQPGLPAAPGFRLEEPPSTDAAARESSEAAEHEDRPALAKPALFHQVPEHAPAAPQTTTPPVHVSVEQATKAALSAFHARAAAKENQKKAEKEQKAAERKKNGGEITTAEKAAQKERERGANAKEKERLRLKEVALKEKVRLQLLVLKSSMAAKAESKTPSGKPPKAKVMRETAKTPSDKPPSKVKAESKRKAEPKEKTPQTKSDDVSKIKLEKEGTRRVDDEKNKGPTNFETVQYLYST